MKKLLLLTLTLFAVPALAQSNEATVDQSGANHDADVTQSGLDNDADVLQTGNDNDATLNQNGTENEAVITQTTNPVYAGVDADVEQLGTSQYAEVTQTGASPRAYAEVRQSDGGGTGDNEAYITQQRSQNDSRAVAHQSGTSNYASSFQDTGGNNEAYIYQGQTDGSSVDNEAIVIQDRTAPGDDASPSHAFATVYQDGTLNAANVNQSLSVNAEAYVDQDGTSNVADIDQWNTIAIDPSHSASIVQGGAENYGRIQQGGDANERNQAWISQTGGDFIEAFLDQKGLGGNHWAEVTQDGSSNRVEGLGGLGTAALQDGADHVLTVSQPGDLNVAQSSQLGSGNAATITQSN